MNLYNTTNIKALPPVEQILPGNFLVVEDTVGTKKLNFNDFVIGPNNTSFYTPLDTRIKTLSTSVFSLSSETISLSSSLNSLATYVLELSATLETAVAELSTMLTTPNVGSFTLSSPFTATEITITSISPTLSTFNVIVTCDTYYKGFGWRLIYKERNNNLFTYTLGVSTAQVAESTDIFQYKVSLI